ncbi:hypothetical protein Clacol_007940 [Clathrus columnatus]|uniref:DUF4283 domain-containing protein n=1 Tax=Clathrus columnatus TaxID=1419009 RepID=A0AAV5AKM5_9AGAM|nr:hypothetical protein Clacol_007940 [Clathrus columnatus]
MIEPAMKEQNHPCQINDMKCYIQLQVFTGEEVNEPEDKTERWMGPSKTVFTQTIRHSSIYVMLSPFLLVIEQDNSNNGSRSSCHETWAYEYTFNWATYMAPSGMSPERMSHGTVTVKNTLDKVCSAIEMVDDYTMKIDFLIENHDWKVEMKPHDTLFWDELCGGLKETPVWVKKMHIPTIDFNMGSLDFFLTITLLLPSGEVIDIDKDQGVQIPGDFFIIGNVKKMKKRS